LRDRRGYRARERVETSRSWICGGALLLGCAAAPAPNPPPAVTPELYRGPLESYLPSPGLRWLVQLRPAKLWADPELEGAVGRVVSAERLRAYVALTAANPRLIDEAWFAQYQLGSLWLFDGSRVGTAVEASLRKRAWTASKPTTTPPDLVTWTYVADREPSAVLRVGDHMVAVAERDPKLSSIVRAYAEKKLKRSPPALASVHLAPLASIDAAAPLRLFALGPFEGHGLDESEELGAGVLALSGALFVDGVSLCVRAHALGTWDASGAPLAELWRSRLLQILETPEVRALGGGALESPVRVECGQLRSNDERTRGLELCHAEARFALASVIDRLQWFGARTLGAIVNEGEAGSTGTPTPVAPSGSD